MGIGRIYPAVLLLVAGSPVQAGQSASRVTEIDQLSNQPGHAKLTDQT
jgi:hypothetical protein